MNKLTKYNRQILLPGFGIEQQEKLFNAKVLVIGAGGLGCPTLLYLAAAGIGNIGIIDFDTVDESNLHRQILYSLEDINQPKVLVAAKKLQGQFQDTKIDTYNFQITNQNALNIISNYDLVVDGSDNFATRYLVNDACVLLKKPWVYGSIFQFEGQVSVFNLNQNNEFTTNYRDLFPEPPNANEVPNCSEAGVIGVLPGIIGNMQANEAIKIITGIGKPLADSLFMYNALNCATYLVELSKNTKAQNLIPKNESEFKNVDYNLTCEVKPLLETTWNDVIYNIGSNQNCIVIDVREPNELPKLNKFNTIEIPLNNLASRISELTPFITIYTVCQSGIRSLKAADVIKQHFPKANVLSIKGGVNSLNI